MPEFKDKDKKKKPSIPTRNWDPTDEEGNDIV